jgi:UDP-GlcNAc:undecaprenyl-phosphate GlcNAc-1-phosphate transferase
VRAIEIAFLALAVTALLVEVARRVAPNVGLIDSPNERKSHSGDIPLVGGIAIFGALLLAYGIQDTLAEHWAFFIAAGVLVAIGVWDDFLALSPFVRLTFQCLAILIICFFGGTVITNLGNILPGLGPVTLGWLAVPFTVFGGVAAINAFNMSDGVDGLCGTITLIALTGLGIAAGVAGRESELVLIVTLGGGLIGFLIFNIRLPKRPQAKAFLGDAGSYLLGLAVFYLAVRLAQGPDRAIEPATAIWFCMLPLLDMAVMVFRRIRRGRSPLDADREHLHHAFLLANFSVTATWIGLAAIATTGMLFGLAGQYANIPEWVMFVSFVLAGLVNYLIISRAWRVLRFLSRTINRRTGARADRRSGIDRRQRVDNTYLNWIPEDRRSGQDRRRSGGDRRNGQVAGASEHQLQAVAAQDEHRSDEAA